MLPASLSFQLQNCIQCSTQRIRAHGRQRLRMESIPVRVVAGGEQALPGSEWTRLQLHQRAVGKRKEMAGADKQPFDLALRLFRKRSTRRAMLVLLVFFSLVVLSVTFVCSKILAQKTHPRVDLKQSGGTYGSMEESGNRPQQKCVMKLPESTLGWTRGDLCVTSTAFLDVQSGDQPLGRLTVALFGEAAPLSASNFLSFVRCIYGPKRCLKNDRFHRIVKNFVIQGGSSSTGRSFINNATFREEASSSHHSVLTHGRHGVLAWAEYPIGSQFYITTCCKAEGPAYLDANHVVFGSLVGEESFQVLDRMKNVQMSGGESPKVPLSITDAGVLQSIERPIELRPITSEER